MIAVRTHGSVLRVSRTMYAPSFASTAEKYAAEGCHDRRARDDREDSRAKEGTVALGQAGHERGEAGELLIGQHALVARHRRRVALLTVGLRLVERPPQERLVDDDGRTVEQRDRRAPDAVERRAHLLRAVDRVAGSAALGLVDLAAELQRRLRRLRRRGGVRSGGRGLRLRRRRFLVTSDEAEPRQCD